ncbi:uncharacterized protein ARMOST_20017 [Armillaria ostoyae]|uniref:Uncharacterized protein n=1 Tax=Armillaria ostoyae TaxID=47428 RepID=A0A284S670_ARMOS|nr:uncharacterized protein ARMOST_20017 [Armillaria ostoyae]
MKFKNLQLPNLRTHIKTVHRDIKHLICQLCRPFVLTRNPADFARHRAEKHTSPQSAPLPRIILTLASSLPALSRPITPARITLVPLTTLRRARPTPTTPSPLASSFIVHAKPPCSESTDLEALLPPCCDDCYVVPKPYLKTHSSLIPTLHDFLRDECGIELIPHHPTHHRLPSLLTSSPESELMSSGSSSSSLSTSGFSPPISQTTTSATTLQWPGSVSTPNPMSDTEYSRFRFIGRNVVSTHLDSQVLPTP